jgi:vacuolar-type H+-ATPase subunit F/Vma7
LPKAAAILPGELASGFALTGLEVVPAEDADAAREALLEAAGKPEYGLLIVEEGLLEAMEPRIREALLARNAPLIVSIPGELRWSAPSGPQADDYVAALIRRAVGYQLNIQL